MIVDGKIIIHNKTKLSDLEAVRRGHRVLKLGNIGETNDEAI